MAPNNKPAIRETVQEPALFDPNAVDWDSLYAESDVVRGYDLAKDKLFDALTGVPFVITRVTFRRGKVRDKRQFAYVSCETMIAPESVLAKRRVNIADLPFDPGALVVFNDGSTGIYRQIVAYLEARGFITLPEGPDNGPHGTVRFDCPPSEWAEIHAGEASTDEDGFFTYTANIRLACPRGLRLSTYENDYNPDGSTTRYLG